jgi:hypothetical protein
MNKNKKQFSNILRKIMKNIFKMNKMKKLMKMNVIN